MRFIPQKQDSPLYLSIFRGGMTTLSGIIFVTLILGCLIQWGGPEKILDSGSLYLFLFFSALTFGAIRAGAASQKKGWVTGTGVGFLISLILLMISLGAGEGINWSVFPLKALMNCFIGAFGGIIGINTVKNDRQAT